MMYPDVKLHIEGQWRLGAGEEFLPVVAPATGMPIGKVARATRPDFDRALAATSRGFVIWRGISAFERSRILRRCADVLRSKANEIAPLLTIEQGKPLVEARAEAMAAADVIDWFAEEGRRTYGRSIPPRAPDVLQLVTCEPVGPVAAFTPWNFPLNQAVRKLAAALANGCSVILKGPEETPASCAALVQTFIDGGVPDGVIGLLFGIPAEISDYLIPHPVIKKVTFTGSTVVGKKLAALAGLHMKRCTMELGGHAPAIVFDDADLETAVKVLGTSKFRNAGQVCIAPTRFLIQQSSYERFVTLFSDLAAGLKVGDGLEPGTQMGPLANARRVQAMEELIADAKTRGATIKTGGKRLANQGYFFEPTVLTDVPVESRIMNEEPFGPVAIFAPFSSAEDALREANRLPFGLAAYVYTRSAAVGRAMAQAIESGMVSINHHGLALPEVPFGGVKDSGYGSEGGSEAMEAYINRKFISQLS